MEISKIVHKKAPSGDLAEIIGLLCAEGNYREYYATYNEYDKRRRNVYLRKNVRIRILEFSNKDRKLINHFLNLLKEEFKYNPKINQAKKGVLRVFITKRNIMDSILKYTSLGCDKWNVPHGVLLGFNNIKKRFIRGYFYGDGSIGKTADNNVRIRFTSINFFGISLVSRMLEDIGILNNLNGPYFRPRHRPCYEIQIRRNSNQKFINDVIGPNPAEKRLLCRD